MSKPLVLQVAERARALINDPRTWTQDAMARTRSNRHCGPTDASAVRYCAYGAILRAANDVGGDHDRSQHLADKVAMLVTGRNNPLVAFEELIAINDGPRATARKAVVGLFERALAAT